jgi:hypothetical protein
MSTRKAYQTLEDRDIHKVETDGPFPCNFKTAWLGRGYYFWDSFIDNAHWWGTDVACYKNGYIICESTYVLDETKCFNLVDNPDHLNNFNSTRKILTEQGLYIQGETTVARIIEHIKNVLKIFTYEAIRVYGVNSINFNSQYSNRTILVYKEGKISYQYLDSTPAIQICFFNKSSLNRKGFKIIHPAEYSEDYLV